MIVGTIYNLLYPIAIIYGIFEIIVAGYKIMRSEGEPKSLSEAKEHLTNSIIGVIFVILGVVILRIIISSFLGQSV
jgi:NhaP-type Na+/H+ or K+/H+ antiporter